ncbi:MAG: hypothetical protein ACQEWL_19660 [Pseudomonadota bacterium]
MSNSKFTYNISGVKTSTSINTVGFFDENYVEPIESAIDIYNEKKQIHLRLLGAPEDSQEWKLLVNLVTLGFVSLVESYCRCIIRRILNADSEAKKHSYSNAVSYGAAIYHTKEMLAEALLEEASFISEKNICESISKFTGLKIQKQSASSLISALNQYEQVCQLRNCIVHRSGHFGTKNALKLGMDEHSNFLEKPIIIGYEAIQSIASVCDNVVKELNDELFSLILSSLPNKYEWTGDFRTDKRYFSKYFDLFYSKEKNLNKGEEQLACFHEFTRHYSL